MATVDSIDQGVIGTPATGVKREGDSLTIEMKQIDGEFQGTVNKDRTEIDGNWSRRGMLTPLVLKPVKNQIQVARALGWPLLMSFARSNATTTL